MRLKGFNLGGALTMKRPPSSRLQFLLHPSCRFLTHIRPRLSKESTCSVGSPAMLWHPQAATPRSKELMPLCYTSYMVHADARGVDAVGSVACSGMALKLHDMRCGCCGMLGIVWMDATYNLTCGCCRPSEFERRWMLKQKWHTVKGNGGT